MRNTALRPKTVARPHPKTNAERQRTFRGTDKGKTAKRELENEQYLARPFIAWDGEGVNDPDGSHRYILLSNRYGGRLIAAKGQYLGTAQIFEFMFAERARFDRRAIHVIYGGSYDTNMILRDLDRETLERVAHSSSARWNGYVIRYRKGKMLQISRGGQTFTLYDVISFFQCSFVKACDDYLGTDWLERDEIKRQKALRHTFTEGQMDDLIHYNDAENANLCNLMHELRLRLFRVGLLIRRWDGPGAVAAALLARERVRAYLASVPESVSAATRTAYAGGRFEVMRFGHYVGPVYEYDINSAYPSAMRYLPALSGGKWRYHKGDPGPCEFAVYNIAWRDLGWVDDPSPFWCRNVDGTIGYPVHGEGWFWTPEYRAARDHRPNNFTVIGAWIFTPASDIKPFAFIDGLYLKRQALKAGGDGAHVGIKLGLNSLYGKLAQQLGWRVGKSGNLRLPPYHQIEYAGYITSHCRAELFKAVADVPEAVIAFETDAVFTTRPLASITTGKALGEYELTEFVDLTYIKSGMWFGTKKDGTLVERTRGIDLDTAHREHFIKAWDNGDTTVPASLSRFVGMHMALMQGMEHWCRWRTEPRAIVPCPTGKRIPIEPYPFRVGRLHSTECPYNYRAENVSVEFPIEWLVENAVNEKYAELRREADEWEW